MLKKGNIFVIFRGNLNKIFNIYFELSKIKLYLKFINVFKL